MAVSGAYLSVHFHSNIPGNDQIKTTTETEAIIGSEDQFTVWVENTPEDYGWTYPEHNFLYWAEFPDGSGNRYEIMSGVTKPSSLATDLDLYAIWNVELTYKASESEFQSVANAIREKGGSSASLAWPNGFVSAVNAIEIEGAVEETAGLSDEVKAALLNLLRHVTYIDDRGKSYYNALYAVLYGGSDSNPRLEVEYTPGNHVVYTDDNLNTLRDYLTVTYYETAESAGTVVTDYTLNGTLTEGASSLVAQYSDAAADFSVEAVDFYNQWVWRYANDGSGNMIKLNYTGVPGTISGKSVIKYNNASTQARRSFAVERGRYPMIDSNGAQSEYYPVPVPSEATKLTADITPSTQQFAVYLCRLVGDEYIKIAPETVSFIEGRVVIEFEAEENLFISFNCRVNSNNDSYTSATEPEMVVTYE